MGLEPRREHERALEAQLAAVQLQLLDVSVGWPAERPQHKRHAARTQAAAHAANHRAARYGVKRSLQPARSLADSREASAILQAWAVGSDLCERKRLPRALRSHLLLVMLPSARAARLEDGAGDHERAGEHEGDGEQYLHTIVIQCQDGATSL